MPVIVRHIRIRGSDSAIGEAMAEFAITRRGLQPDQLLGDARYVRARRVFFERNYPAQLRRMRGVATALRLHPEDNRFDFSILGPAGGESGPADRAGTARYSPPWVSDDEHGRMTRDAGIRATRREPLELHLMEWRSAGPSRGSIAIHIDDILSGTLVGINTARLTVCAVGSGDPGFGLSVPWTSGSPVMAVGLHELGLMRFVLDTCRTVDDAQAALLASHEFPMTSSARYLVADETGRSFAYEVSPDHVVQRITDGGGEPQLLSSALDGDGEPVGHWRCVVDQVRRSLELTLGLDAVGGEAVGIRLTAAL